MPTKFVMSFGLAVATLVAACDDLPEDRSVTLAALADPDLDPEVRAELAAELIADEDDDHAAALDLAAPTDATPGTCFFCPPPQNTDPGSTTPVVLNPYVAVNAQSNTILFMQSASSFITLPGATVKLQVPYSTQSYGPYALSFDQSGTLIRANVSGAFPAGACRMITVTNPNNKSSSPVTLCR